MVLLFDAHWMWDMTAERREEKNPTLYLLTLEQMIENDYPIPSYMADVFQKPEGWVETPEPQMHSLLEKQSTASPKIYAIDCEMVCPFPVSISLRAIFSLGY